MAKITHAEYCNNKEARRNARTTIFPDGVSVHLINGEYLTEKERNERYPIHGELVDWREKKHNKGDNPNKKNNFKNL